MIESVRRWILPLALLVVLLTLHQVSVDHINNYRIFSRSSSHLLEGNDLYALYPAEHGDYFKYAPTFALLMVPFSLLPDAVGVVIWNLLGLMIFLMGVRSLQWQSSGKVHLLFWVVLPELIGVVQNSQSNLHLVGIFFLVFGNLEREKPFQAALLLSLAAQMKVFALALGCLGLLYRSRWRFCGSMILWSLLFTVMPALLVGWSGLTYQLGQWIDLQGRDLGHLELGFYSIMHIINLWVEVPNRIVQLMGAVMVALPTLFWNRFRNYSSRFLVFCSLLLWMVLFNHRAESPTFIIAMSGFALWYGFFISSLGEGAKGDPNARSSFQRSRRVYPKYFQIIYLVFVLLCVSVLYSDLTSSQFKEEILKPYYVKAWPILITYLWIQTAIYRSLLRSDEDASLLRNQYS